MLENIDINDLEAKEAPKQSAMLQKMTQYKTDNGKDFILDEAKKLMETAGNDPMIKAGVTEKICSYIMEYKKFAIQDHYIDLLGANYKPKKAWKDEVKRLRDEMMAEDEQGFRPGENADTETLEKFGFYTEDNKYFFASKTGNFMSGTNFVIEPLFHISSKTDNKRLIRVINEFGYSRIIDVPSKVMVSPDQFQQFLYAEGNFLIFIAKQQFMKILNHIGQQFPICWELKTLGWQPEGFYAFSNGAYNGHWQEVDEMGIVEIDGKNFFSPAFSDVYKDVRDDDDEYESDRYFIYKPSKTTFSDWAKLMVSVYGDNGKVAVAYLIISLFRSDIYERFKVFPHLFLFGEKGSGKSQLGWSLSNVFLQGMPPFNLNSGTDVAFFRRLGRFRNIVVWYDEYTNQIDGKRFQALKSAYDGVGREKGKATQDSRTHVDRINSATCISGQYLPTLDDNALYTRSMVLTFKKKSYTKQEIQNYNDLKKIEEDGLSNIILELLENRETFTRKYSRIYMDMFDDLKDELAKVAPDVDERILRNYTTLLAAVSIIEKETSIKLPFTYSNFANIIKQLVVEQSEKLSSTDALATFWNILSYLIDAQEVQEDVDFRIEKRRSYKATRKMLGVKKTVEITFPDSKEHKVLYLNTAKVHASYLVEHRRQRGETGVGLQTLQDYIHSHKAYLGLCDSYRFRRSKSSAHMFDYDLLNANFERSEATGGEMGDQNEPPEPEPNDPLGINSTENDKKNEINFSERK